MKLIFLNASNHLDDKYFFSQIHFFIVNIENKNYKIHLYIGYINITMQIRKFHMNF